MDKLLIILIALGVVITLCFNAFYYFVQIFFGPEYLPDEFGAWGILLAGFFSTTLASYFSNYRALEGEKLNKGVLFSLAMGFVCTLAGVLFFLSLSWLIFGIIRLLGFPVVGF